MLQNPEAGGPLLERDGGCVRPQGGANIAYSPGSFLQMPISSDPWLPAFLSAPHLNGTTHSLWISG